MTAITVELKDEIAEEVRRLAHAQKRSETDIVGEAVAVYVQAARPMPTGIGKYHSGQEGVSEQARELLRQAVKEKRWP